MGLHLRVISSPRWTWKDALRAQQLSTHHAHALTNRTTLADPEMECLVLITSSPTTVAVRSAQEYLIQLLDAHKIAYTAVDCSEPANKDLRSAAWAVSGKRAVCVANAPTVAPSARARARRARDS